MKIIPLLLAGSLGVNLILAGVLLRHPECPAASTAIPDPPRSADAGEIAGAGAGRETPATAVTWRDLPTADLAALAASLRAAGLADHLVRAIITAEIDERFRVREAALVGPRPPLRYWQSDTRREPFETRLARLELKREKSRLRLAILGPDPGTDVADDPIPAEKRELAKLITEDYDALMADLGPRGRGMRTPEEDALLQTLEADRRRELEALFTPDELAEYDFRTSREFQQLRRELSHFDASEAEFRRIHELRSSFQSQVNQPFDFAAREGESEEEHRLRLAQHFRDRAEAKTRLEQDLRESLGEERYRDYRLARDSEMLQLRELLTRSQQPAAAADRVFDLRESIASESRRIGEDFTRPAAERRAAVSALAERFRAELPGLLDPAAADAYLDSAQDWLNQLRQGSMIEFDGGSRTARRIVEAPPAVER